VLPHDDARSLVEVPGAGIIAETFPCLEDRVRAGPARAFTSGNRSRAFVVGMTVSDTVCWT
jgi:hypothetical protein